MQDNNKLFDTKMRYDLTMILGYRKYLSNLVLEFNNKYSDKGISFDKAETLNYMTLEEGVDLVAETLGVYKLPGVTRESVRYSGVTLWESESKHDE